MTNKNKMSFLEHLDEMRSLLIKAVITVVLFVMISIPFAPKITNLFLSNLPQAIKDSGGLLQILEVSEGFTLTLRIAFATGIILATPFLILFADKFIKPGLSENEKKYSSVFVLSAFLLFILGCFIGYTITLPMAIKLMYKTCYWIGGVPNWTMSNYIMFCLQVVVAFGLAFLMPIIVFILVKLGIVKVAFLRKNRKYALVIILIISMFLTPADLLTLIVMAVPLYILYELTILVSSFGLKKKAIEN
ncbi:MAG: twin-arginine translocase subunit TatC [Kiritimatiellae bacterium]|jgi:sec-independent protein translocase protein TatC|nr:twin-arginine translocase subunit TatC [Kiritimatiellia bacterium]